jgi:Spy/CpxP family protein refolding chaperone
MTGEHDAVSPERDESGGRGPSWLPSLRSPWWTALLVASLALNLLVIAAVSTHMLRREHGDRFHGASYSQLVPRRFLSDLPRDRRKELILIFRDYRDEFRSGRDQSREIAARLADALAAEPYDAAKVSAVTAEFGKAGAGLIDQGTELANTFFSRLTPEERKMLAQRIREKAEGGGRRK